MALESVPTTLDLVSESFSLDAEHLAVLNLTCIKSGIEPGEYLCREGIMTPHVIRAAILCQLFMHEKLLPKELAFKAMKLVSAKDCSVEDALDKSGWDRAYFENIRQLRDLVMQSGLISEKERRLAFSSCLDFKMPFLATLVQRQTMTEETADYVLTIQQTILEGGLSSDEGVDLLSRCTKPDGTMATPEAANKPLTREVARCKERRIGELLVASTIITPLQLITAVEEARATHKLTGEVLVEHDFLSAVDLKRVLNAQGRIENGTLSFADAVGKLDPKRVLPP